LTRSGCVLASSLLLLATPGCGGDDEPDQPAKRPAAGSTATETGPREDETATAEEKRDTEERETVPASPEEQPGGAGDEEAARVEAAFVGRAGRIRPAVVHVPPYIAVRVSLRSADGSGYGLQFPGTQLQTQGRGATPVAVTLDGLRPGEALNGRADDGRRVRIVADAEPGP
jgi:hypothetical protein